MVGNNRELSLRRLDGQTPETTPSEPGPGHRLAEPRDKAVASNAQRGICGYLMSHEIDRFFELSLDLLCIASTDGYFKLVNPAFGRVLGWSVPDLLGRPYLEFVHPDDRKATEYEAERLASGVPTVSFTNRFRCKDGSYRNLLWTAYPETETGFLYAVAKDITEFALAQQKFQLAVEASPAALLMIDSDGSIKMANKAAERLFGYDSGELISKPVEILVPMELGKKHVDSRRAFLGHPTTRPMGSGRELTARHKDGSEIPVEIGLNPIHDDQGIQVLCSVVDLTSRKKAERAILDLAEELERANRRLTELAATDPLTGLKNRRTLLEQLETHLQLAHRKKRPISVVIVDIDQFKKHNDLFGHLAGDELLRQVAGILKKTARRSDFVGRFGGDEFVLGLPETDKEGAINLSERILAAVVSHSWKEQPVTLSIGVTTLSFDDDDQEIDIKDAVERLLHDADSAMYLSKAAGRNRATHSEAIDGGS